eukprot:1319585-Amorphochlora_amoeboformis.AAC.1
MHTCRVNNSHIGGKSFTAHWKLYTVGLRIVAGLLLVKVRIRLARAWARVRLPVSPTWRICEGSETFARAIACGRIFIFKNVNLCEDFRRRLLDS